MYYNKIYDKLNIMFKSNYHKTRFASHAKDGTVIMVFQETRYHPN